MTMLVRVSLVAAILAITACRETSQEIPVHKTGAAQPLVGIPAPIDTAVGDLQSSVASFAVATSAGVVKDAGGYFIGANACNEGTSTAWLQFYNQTALDAGGTNDAGTAPSMVPLRIPAGACASVNEPQVFSNGIVWYSSSVQGVVTIDAGTQNLAVDTIYR